MVEVSDGDGESLGGDNVGGYDGRHGRQGEKIVQVVLWWLC